MDRNSDQDENVASLQDEVALCCLEPESGEKAGEPTISVGDRIVFTGLPEPPREMIIIEAFRRRL